MKTRILLLVFVIVFSSMFVGNVYGSIYLDKSVYTWTDKINLRITEHGVDADGTSVKVYTDNHELKNYKLSKAGNGLYTGEIFLTGFSHDVDGDGKSDTNPRTYGTGPNNGFLESGHDDEFTIYIKFGDGDTISKSAKINWNKGDIVFDRWVNGAGTESIHLQIKDIDMNLNPDSLDTLPIHVFSDSDKAGIIVNAIERQDDPGLFETLVSISPNRASSGHTLFALANDEVYAQYDDYTLPEPYGVDDDLAIITKLVPYSLEQLDDKEVEWSQANYKVKNGTGTAKIIVTDSEKNISSDSIDTLQVFVYSDSFREGITLDLHETQKDTGIFERSFTFSDKRSAPSVLYGFDGDTVTAFYDPYSLDSKSISMTATMFLGSTGPPLERAPASSARIIDSLGNSIHDPAVGQQIQITSDIANGQNREQKFAYLVMIQNDLGITEHLSWINGTLNPQSAFSPSASWIPQKEGVYIATMFVWESVNNPSALSPPISLEFAVISEAAQKIEQHESGYYQEMFMFIVPQDEFEQFADDVDLRTLHYYEINHQELSSLPRLSLLVNMTKDFSHEPVSELKLRMNDVQIEQYDVFFEQKCREQRPYATHDDCVQTDFAFEYDETWYYIYPKLAPHRGAIEDSTSSWDPEYFTKQ